MTHQQAVDALASERYLLGEMSEAERFEFEAHYFDCQTCAEDVTLGETIRQEVRRAGSAAPAADAPRRAAVLTSARWWRRPMVAAPWAVAATLAIVTGYQSATVRGLRDAMSAQAVEPVMLRGATRGAAARVTLARGQRFVALSMDLLTPPQSSALGYELIDATGILVVSGQSPISSSGGPLMLLIPADELQTAGRYTLTLRDSNQNGVVGEYEFEVSY